MPGIPSLPTDNLYKFIALSGLFLIGLAFYLAVTDVNRDYERAGPLIARNAVLRSEQDEIDVMLEKAERDTAYARANLVDLRRRQKAQHSERVTLSADEEALIWSLHHSTGQTSYWPLLGFGSLLSVVGFVLWFRRLQRLQDELLRIELRAARARANGGTPQPSNEQSKTRING